MEPEYKGKDTLIYLKRSIIGGVLVIYPEIFFILHRIILCYMKAALAPSL
jgi:hypothetical protein